MNPAFSREAGNQLTAFLSLRNIVPTISKAVPSSQPLPMHGVFFTYSTRIILPLTVCFFIASYCSARTRAAKPPRKKITLEQAVSRALRHNRQLRSNALDLNSRQISLDNARKNFSVQVSPLSSINYSSGQDEKEHQKQVVWKVGGEVSKKFPNGIRIGVKPALTLNQDTYGTGISCSLAVPLLRRFGRDTHLNTVLAREYSLASSYRRQHRYKINTVLATVQAVYALIRAQYLVKLYEEQLTPLKGHLRTARIREKAGIGRSMDGYRAELRLKKVEEQLNNAQR
ncbi:MAG: TolC family protein, partial [Candidatus Electrothrix sp. EH2]|nr:TolC family protein [Candidatus Electrothrix sp. EH2]